MEVDLPTERDYKAELIFKHSPRGQVAKKLASIKRWGLKRKIKTSFILSVIAGLVSGLIIWVYFGIGGF